MGLANHQGNNPTLFAAPWIAVPVMALLLLAGVGVLWFLFGPEKLRPRRVPHRWYRFQDGRDTPVDDRPRCPVCGWHATGWGVVDRHLLQLHPKWQPPRRGGGL